MTNKIKMGKVEIVRNMMHTNPKTKASEVVSKLNVAKSYAYVLMTKARKADSKPAKVTQSVDELKVQIKPFGVTLIDTDPVNHPKHYTTGGIETIDFIEAKKLGYNLGNVVKYITRAGLKSNQIEDLRKAQWYLTREINSLK